MQYLSTGLHSLDVATVLYFYPVHTMILNNLMTSLACDGPVMLIVHRSKEVEIEHIMQSISCRLVHTCHNNDHIVQNSNNM